MAQEGLSEAKRQAPAASSTREAVAGDADMVDEERMGGEKAMLLVDSPMCQTFCDLIMVMWNANAVSEVKYENLVERCEVQRNARRLFLHEDLWDG